ncbi:amidohydrolase [Caulobacter sp. UNC279MFTsu5.1]|uniref:amidohydrolase family protein n=1 Tax=Caulobacter sp. UNC279MFTsu5.1 TaxID=1502775 RepID=UPI00037C346F|nr:amidohydrolase family protein [Caulobacter sp. UNC279MFTsu5.1]SFI57442.1 Amidohydrolase [Caulobacter sp. UNC279MFTsu5.1]
MLIVDSQIHLWTGDQAPPHHWRAPYRAEQALRDMDEAGVARAVVCPAIWDVDANAYSVQAAQAHPDRFAVLGWFDLDRPADPAFVEQFVGQAGMLGLRFVLFHPAQLEALASGGLDWIWGAAHDLALPVGFIAPPQVFGDVARIARRYPRMRLLLDHIGIAHWEKAPDVLARLDEILALANEPNIAVKASATPCVATDAYPFESIHPILKRTFDAFGPQRTFWGTDYTRLTCSWSEGVRLFTEALPWLKGEDLDWVMGRGVCEWIGWR